MSEFLKLNSNDFWKGLIVAMISAALTALLATMEAGGLPTGAQLKTIGIVALTSGVAYLTKNLFTPAQK